MLNEWLRDKLHEKRIKQIAMARELTERLGRSIDAAAMNKMVKGTRKIAADELLEIEKIFEEAAPNRSYESAKETAIRPASMHGVLPETLDDDDRPLDSLGTQEQIVEAFQAADKVYEGRPFNLEGYTKAVREFLIRIQKNEEERN